VICVGGTSMGACDHVREICELAQQEGLYTHVDAAWAVSAMICPEFRHLWEGIELADSIVLNPHKWLGASLECSAHFLREPDKLINTMSIRPEYLKTYNQEELTNFSEWSVQLGRRFRALKVWFLLRAYGLEGLRERIRNHIDWSLRLCEQLRSNNNFDIVTEPILSLFTFRLVKAGLSDKELDKLNLELVNRINNDGRIYLTQSVHDGIGVIRFMTGQFDMQESDIEIAHHVITELGEAVLSRPTDQQIAAFQNIPTGFVVDAMDGTGAMHSAIKPIDQDLRNAHTAAGPAITVDNTPGDILALFAAPGFIQSGDIVINAFKAYQGCAAFGDRVSGMIKNAGAKAMITDGPVRDLAGVLEVNLPVWCTGINPNSPVATGLGRIGLPVQIGGLEVETGDMIIADRDGVVVVPFEMIDKIIDRLEQSGEGFDDDG